MRARDIYLENFFKERKKKTLFCLLKYVKRKDREREKERVRNRKRETQREGLCVSK